MSCIQEDELTSALKSDDIDSVSFTRAIDVVVSAEYPYNDIYELLKNDETRTYYDVVYTSFLSAREENKRREKINVNSNTVIPKCFDAIKLCKNKYECIEFWYDNENVVVSVLDNGHCYLNAMLLDLASSNSVNTICDFNDIKSLDDLLIQFSLIINSKIFFDCVVDYVKRQNQVLRHYCICDILSSLKQGIDIQTLVDGHDDVLIDVILNVDEHICNVNYNDLLYAVNQLHKINIDVNKFKLLNKTFYDVFCYASVIHAFEPNSHRLENFEIIYYYLFHSFETHRIRNHRNYHKIKNIARTTLFIEPKEFTIESKGCFNNGWRMHNIVLFGAHYRTVFTIEEFNDRCNNHCFRQLMHIFNEYLRENKC